MGSKKSEKCLDPFTYIWTIENYPTMGYEGKVLSPMFTVHCLERTQWYVEVNISHCTDLCECALWRVDDKGPQNIEICFEFTVLGAYGASMLEKVNRGTFEKGSCARVTEFKAITFFYRRKIELLPRNSLTLRCRMWKRKTKIFTSDLCFARTRLGTEYTSFIWTINDFSTIRPLEERSHTLRFALYGFLFHFKLSVFFTEIDNGKYMWLKITIINAPRKFHLSWELSLVEADGKSRFPEKGYEYMGCQERKEIMARLFPRSVLRAYTSSFLLCDALCLKCEFEIGIGDIWNCIDHLTSGVVEEHDAKTDYPDKNSNLANSFMEQRDDESSLRVNSRVDNLTLPTHKSDQSLDFKNMPVGDMRDRPDILHLLIRYAYTDTIPDLEWKHALYLSKAAEKYKMFNLRNHCFTFLEQNLSLSNCCDVIKHVYLYSTDDFQKAVERFFLQHDIQIFNSGMWKTLKQDNPREALEILERVYVHKIKVFEISM